ncbi:MAG: homoserine O-acetyltransferase [Akkermansia sp.]|nr:homoserine O-acetyltransferase [Akkermansia sp.]
MQQIVQSHIFRLGDFTFHSGETLPDIQLAYETYGTLNEDKSNAILLFHALTGSHHAHGYNDNLPEAGTFWQPENHQGWWDRMIGPGKPLDTERFFIICANYLGSCYGSSGPTQTAPDGEPWGSRFPLTDGNDQARAQIQLLDHFGIDRFAIVAPSLGGMLALTLAALYPERVRSMVIIGAAHRPAINHKLEFFEQVLAIELDPAYRAGRYPLSDPPNRGLALARIISHKLFVYQDGLEKRARKGICDSKGMLTWYQPSRNTESYMLHQGTKFAKRFDANAYIRIVNLWAGYDLPAFTGMADTDEVFRLYARHNIRFLLFSIDTDYCFTADAIEEFHQELTRNGVSSVHTRIQSEKGHDSFLLEPDLYADGLAEYLK